MHIKLLPWTNGARLSVQLFGIFQRNSSMIQTGIHRNSSKFGYVSGLFDASIKLIAKKKHVAHVLLPFSLPKSGDSERASSGQTL